MNISKQTAGAVLGMTLFAGTLVGGGSWLFAQEPDVTPADTTIQSEADQAAEGQEAEANEAEEGDDDDANEVGEANEAEEGDDDDANEVGEAAEEGDDNDANEAQDANETEEDDDAAESAALQGLATISAADAEAAALADYPGATVVETELEKENGAVIYEVKLDNGLEVIVDAADGTVLGTESD